MSDLIHELQQRTARARAVREETTRKAHEAEYQLVVRDIQKKINIQNLGRSADDGDASSDILTINNYAQCSRISQRMADLNKVVHPFTLTMPACTIRVHW